MDDDDSKQGSDKFEKSKGLRLEPVWSLNGQYSRMDTKGLDTSALADLAHAGPTLVVLNDFERLVVTAGAAIDRARDNCRLLLRALLEQCSNIKVLMTCSSFSGIGQVSGVTEQIIPLGRMADEHTAFLLLQRDPELKRRATNPNMLQPPRIAPRDVMNCVESKFRAPHAIDAIT